MKLFEPRGGQTGERREQHLPDRVPVDAYGNGGFRFGGMSHRGSVLCLPSGVHGWPVVDAAGITVDSLRPVFAEAAGFDTLLIGTGNTLVPPGPDVVAALRMAGIRFEPMSTGAALRIFNIMQGENRKVAAAFLAVD